MTDLVKLNLSGKEFSDKLLSIWHMHLEYRLCRCSIIIPRVS